MKSLVPTHDIVFITLDTLRFDVAQLAFEQGMLPNFADQFPQGWTRRHSPATFTYAAHHAFFAGFLPTPIEPGPHPRLFASSFHGSETTTEATFTFEEPDLPAALAQRGYKTLCIGGVGFFNKKTPLGNVLPQMFQESYWDESMSVINPRSTEIQVDLAIQLARATHSNRMFLFINVSALHQPNHYYIPGATVDSVESQMAALIYVDHALGKLWGELKSRGPGFCILCSDHGTAYGEDGYRGHRLAHQVVWDVPYAEFIY